jgi:hypothetical protein
MARNDHLLVIDQKWNVESERLDALSNLANLFVGVDSRIARVRLQRYGPKVGDL